GSTAGGCGLGLAATTGFVSCGFVSCGFATTGGFVSWGFTSCGLATTGGLVSWGFVVTGGCVSWGFASWGFFSPACLSATGVPAGGCPDGLRTLSVAARGQSGPYGLDPPAVFEGSLPGDASGVYGLGGGVGLPGGSWATGTPLAGVVGARAAWTSL